MPRITKHTFEQTIKQTNKQMHHTVGHTSSNPHAAHTYTHTHTHTHSSHLSKATTYECEKDMRVIISQKGHRICCRSMRMGGEVAKGKTSSQQHLLYSNPMNKHIRTSENSQRPGNFLLIYIHVVSLYFIHTYTEKKVLPVIRMFAA